jgi:hypothetical protein
MYHGPVISATNELESRGSIKHYRRAWRHLVDRNLNKHSRMYSTTVRMQGTFELTKLNKNMDARTLNLILKPYSMHSIYWVMASSNISSGRWLQNLLVVLGCWQRIAILWYCVRIMISRSSEIEILFFSPNWCPHCGKCKPDRDKSLKDVTTRSHGQDFYVWIAGAPQRSENDMKLRAGERSINKMESQDVDCLAELVITFEGKSPESNFPQWTEVTRMTVKHIL